MTAALSSIPVAARTAERIIRDANAAAEVIARIRALFSQSDHDHVPVDLNAVIREVCELNADKLVSSNVRLELDLDLDLPGITGDRVQLEQVVLNLVRNAIEAMLGMPPASRCLRIESRRDADGTLSVEVEVTCLIPSSPCSSRSSSSVIWVSTSAGEAPGQSV